MAAKNNRRIARFASVGIVNTALDFGVLFILVNLGVARIPANVISTTVAFIFSFTANRRYTFRSSGDMRRQLILFTIVTLFGLWGLQSVVLWVGGQLVGTETLALFATKIVATIVTLIWNYLMYARVVFIDQDRI